jgi:lipoyl(octanoyl) transferase
VACYPILPLDATGRTLAGYLHDLQEIIIELLRENQIAGIIASDHPGVRVNARRIAHIGVAIRDSVTAYGLVLNADPDLEPFRAIHCDGDRLPMTSLQREAVGRVRIPGVRQRLVELIAARFGFDRVSVFHAHPGAPTETTRHAPAQRT